MIKKFEIAQQLRKEIGVLRENLRLIDPDAMVWTQWCLTDIIAVGWGWMDKWEFKEFRVEWSEAKILKYLKSFKF